jgi:hypothetical protein
MFGFDNKYNLGSLNLTNFNLRFLTHALMKKIPVLHGLAYFTVVLISTTVNTVFAVVLPCNSLEPTLTNFPLI